VGGVVAREKLETFGRGAGVLRGVELFSHPLVEPPLGVERVGCVDIMRVVQVHLAEARGAPGILGAGGVRLDPLLELEGVAPGALRLVPLPGGRRGAKGENERCSERAVDGGQIALPAPDSHHVEIIDRVGPVVKPYQLELIDN
jgi:hypothetical protein